MVPIRVPEGSLWDIIDRLRRGLDLDVERDDLLGLFERVYAGLPVYDAAKAQSLHGPGFDSYSARRGRLTEYLRAGGPMADLFEDDDECGYRVQMTWADVLAVFRGKTNNAKVSHVITWDGLDWFAVDAAVSDGERPSRMLARELRVSIGTLQGVFRMYGVGRTVRADD